MGKLRQRAVRIQLRTAWLQSLCVFPEGWLDEMQPVPESQVKYEQLSPHPEWIELLSVLGSFGTGLKQEECALRTKRLKKKKNPALLG